MRRIMKTLALLGVIIASPLNSFALDGVPYCDLIIKGKTYSVPIPNDRTREDYYLLKKAIKGDTDAREMLIGAEKVHSGEAKWIFIGDIGIIRWVRLTMNEIEVRSYDENGKRI